MHNAYIVCHCTFIVIHMKSLTNSYAKMVEFTSSLKNKAEYEMGEVQGSGEIQETNTSTCRYPKRSKIFALL